jgi:hypothetical protein
MGRPKDGYFIDGERVPSVTTILSRYKESGGLLYWAWQQGKDGKDFRETRDAAADAGTCAHEMVECDIRGKAFDASKYKPETFIKADGAYQGYLEWKDQTKLEVADTEVSLVSRTHRFGGTLDAMLVRGKLSLGDWKTSGGIYVDYLLQLAAYELLWEENHPTQPIDGGFYLLRFSKQESPDDPISFAQHYWSDLSIARACFLHLRAAYDLDKRLKKLC